MTLTFALYTFAIAYSLILKKWLITGIVIASIPFAVLFFRIFKKIRISSAKNQIQQALEKRKNNIEFKPFININKSPWYIIELLPGINTAQAKNLAMQIKTIRKVENFDELFKIVPVDVVAREIIKAIVKF
jgi:ABC-type bacteriocin/lantibiotic exporter with double-glycine peptidase domain